MPDRMEEAPCRLTLHWEFVFPPLDVPEGTSAERAADAIRAFVGDTAKVSVVDGGDEEPCVLVETVCGEDGRAPVIPRGMRCSKPAAEWAWRVELPGGASLSPHDVPGWTVGDLVSSGGRVVFAPPLEWDGAPPSLS